jgi:5-methyltetrahydropteroyltriglutamate--homocysteine methyltransferase
MKPLLSHEIGSLDKPSWRVKAMAGRPPSDQDVDLARVWGERVNVPDYPALLDLLRRAPLDREGKEEVRRWSSLYAVRMLESAGVEVVYDGEQQRSEMYDWTVKHSNGFEPRGSVRAFDNKYYTKAAAVGPLSLRAPFHSDEFAYVRSVARADLKVPATGAYTIADWSFDEYYRRDGDLLRPAAERR